MKSLRGCAYRGSIVNKMAMLTDSHNMREAGFWEKSLENRLRSIEGSFGGGGVLGGEPSFHGPKNGV